MPRPFVENADETKFRSFSEANFQFAHSPQIKNLLSKHCQPFPHQTNLYPQIFVHLLVPVKTCNNL